MRFGSVGDAVTFLLLRGVLLDAHWLRGGVGPLDHLDAGADNVGHGDGPGEIWPARGFVHASEFPLLGFPSTCVV
jgi:hypothetical protein